MHAKTAANERILRRLMTSGAWVPVAPERTVRGGPAASIQAQLYIESPGSLGRKAAGFVTPRARR